MKTFFTTTRISAKRDLLESITIGLLLTTISYIIGLLANWIHEINWLEIFAVLTSYACTYLCVKERRINYLVGVITTAAYSILFLQNSLLLSAILNIYLIPTLAYGWLRWGKDSQTRPVTNVTLRAIPIYLLVTALGWTGAAIISQAFGGAMAWADSAILAGTILAQFLLDNKKLQTWIVWAIVNVFAIYTYFTAGLSLVAFQYVFFLANTMYGYAMWKRGMNNENKAANNVLVSEI